MGFNQKCHLFLACAGLEYLMGDLCFNGAITNIHPKAEHASTAYYLSEQGGCQINHPVQCEYFGDRNLPVDSLGLGSLLDDFFSNVLSLTSYLSCQLICFIEDLVQQDVSGHIENFVAGSCGMQSGYSNHSFCKSNAEGCSSGPGIFIADAYPTIQRRTVSDIRTELLVNTRYEVVENCYNHQISFIIKGLMLPFFGLRLAWRLALFPCRLLFYYIRRTQVQVRSIISRLRTTLRGSSDDIGWLQSTPGMAPVKDGTSRFLELLENIR
ncbi:hypothetical protein Tsubulata_003173 [Turnera subulata]|uniref:Uncharacterized protein n=1 Tax=Turnera subulata TaxID=218843 RepID=A0A9Q0FXT0_9ROSI|nr:hypothetical protein Tsubulata_003173 [Turnera subulata]